MNCETEKDKDIVKPSQELILIKAELGADLIKKNSEDILKLVDDEEKQLGALYSEMVVNTGEDMAETVKKESETLKQVTVNLGRATAITASMEDELTARWHDLNKGKKIKRLSSPANALIDAEETNSNHFAKGLNFYKLVLLCSVGSFLGVVIEMLWCLVTQGFVENRAGLVYGPFNLLYGVGAVALAVTLYRFRNRGAWLSFLGGLVVGSAVEYVCSFLQELAFGTRSWDYSHMPFNINGRICLLYSVFWGVLGVMWIKSIYPRLAQWILKIPQKAGKIISWLLVVFFVVNASVTVIAMARWTQRDSGIPASNEFWEFVDQRFPDERMRGIFVNMRFE